MKAKALLLFSFIILLFSGCNPEDNAANSNIKNSTTDAEFAKNFGAEVSKDFIGQVVDINDNPIQNALVKIGAKSAQTDVNGVFIINQAGVYERFAYVTAVKAGFVDGSRALVPTSGKNNVKIMLFALATTQVVSSGVNSEVTLVNGTKVNFDGAFQDANGNAYSGDVNVSAFHLMPSDPNIGALMPGMLYAQDETGTEKVLETFGMLHVALHGSAGQELQIASGHLAQITMAIDASQIATAPATIPLWHFDEVNGYWRQDGSASKQGDKYVGNVSHFSWWNCDTFSSVVSLTVTVTDVAGNPISNAGISLITSSNFASYVELTNANGQVAGNIPANSILTLNIHDTCGTIISTSQIGPFAVNTILPNIVLSGSQILPAAIIGNLVKCDNTNVTIGYAFLVNNGHTLLTPITNGNFNFQTLWCVGNTTVFTLKGVDYENLQQTGDLQFSYNFPVTNVGNLQACNAIDEFISYKIDNAPTVYLLESTYGYFTNVPSPGPDQSLNLSVSAHNQSQQGIYISGIALLPGLYSTDTFQIEGLSTFISSGITNTMVFNVGAIGNTGEFIDITFSGTYNDALGIHTLTGTAHVIRDN